MEATVYQGIDGVLIKADLAQASELVKYSVDGGETYRATPFQTADASHDADKLIRLVDDWLECGA